MSTVQLIAIFNSITWIADAEIISTMRMKNRGSPFRIAFVFNKGRLHRLPFARKGESPAEFFFGALELEKKGYKIGYFEVDVDWAPGIVGGGINCLLDRGLMPEKMSGGVVVQIGRLLKQFRLFDCVVGTTSGIAFALALYKCLGLLKNPIVAIHCGLLNNSYCKIRRNLTNILLRQMYTVLYGDGERGPILELFSDIENKVIVNQFGVDTKFWHPGGNKKGRYILSVGSDGRRDYETLIEAAKYIPLEIRILTLHNLPQPLPENVSLLKGSWHKEIVSDKELRSLYQNAPCVVVPLQESFQPSGQSVVLQAMACGCPVILTRTAGLWSEEMMVDGNNVLFTKAGDSQHLVAKINEICNNAELGECLSKKGRDTVCKEASIEGFTERMEEFCMLAATESHDIS